MTTTYKQFTEPIFDRLAEYRVQLIEHPLSIAGRAGKLSRDTLNEFAFHQYSDSILWIPMLAQMKSKAARSDRLRRAIEENIAHEAGLEATSHVTLAAEMMRSLGRDARDALTHEPFMEAARYWISDEFDELGEPEIAGWLLGAESLVPVLFAQMAPSFDALGCDTRYFHEHIEVDSDEHATWMAESVEEVVDLYGPIALVRMAIGLNEAWAETRAIPDLLWARQLTRAA